MSASNLPMPIPTPPTDPSTSAPNTQVQSANTTRIASNPMSVSLLLRSDPPETPPISRITSFEADAPQASAPGSTMAPVNDPALHGTNAESLRTDTINDEEAITANVEDKSLNAALTISSTTADQNNGKGTDSELYDVNPLEGGNTENGHVYRSEDYDTAQSLLQLRYVENEVDAAFVLVDLRAKFYKSENESDHLDSSETEDEGPPLSTDRKIRFCTNCNGSQVQLSAHEGDAVLAILSLRSLPRAFIPEICNGEARCRRCFNILGSLHARYIHRYRELGWERFEREETVPLDDDTVDSPDHERDGAAVYDGETDRTEMLPSPPKLSRTTLERLEKEKREWRPEPNPLTVTSADTSVSVTQAVEPIQPSLYAKESNVRGSVSHPEATAAHTANDASPPSQRPSYTSLRSGDSFPRPSVSVDPTKTPSSLLPFTQQARQTKPVTPSPLKQVSNAAEVTQMSPSPERHNLPTRPSLQRLLGTLSTYNPFGSVQASPDRAQPTNDSVHLRGGDIAPAREQQPGSVTPTNETGRFSDIKAAHRVSVITNITNNKIAPPTLPTPPTTSSRKRKAATQSTAVEQQPSPSPSQQRNKKRKGKSSPAQAEHGGGNNPWSVNADGVFEIGGSREGVHAMRTRGKAGFYYGAEVSPLQLVRTARAGFVDDELVTKDP